MGIWSLYSSMTPIPVPTKRIDISARIYRLIRVIEE